MSPSLLATGQGDNIPTILLYGNPGTSVLGWETVASRSYSLALLRYTQGAASISAIALSRAPFPSFIVRTQMRG
jgi:hypothetical protein